MAAVVRGLPVNAVSASNERPWSGVSCNTPWPRPSRAASICPARTTTGDESDQASANAARVLNVPGPVVVEHTPGTTQDPGVPVGGERRALLVAGQDVPDRRRPRQGVVEAERVDPRDPEHGPHGRGLQDLDDRIANPSRRHRTTLFLGAWDAPAAPIVGGRSARPLSTIYNDGVPLDRPGYERRARARLSRIPGLPDVPSIPAMPSMPGLPSLPGRRSSSPRLPLSTDMHNHRMMRGDSIAMGVISSVTPFLAVFIVRLGGSAFDVSLLTAIPAIGGFLLAIPVGQFLQGKARIVPWYSGSRMVAHLSYAVAALVVLIAPA